MRCCDVCKREHAEKYTVPYPQLAETRSIDLCHPCAKFLFDLFWDGVRGKDLQKMSPAQYDEFKKLHPIEFEELLRKLVREQPYHGETCTKKPVVGRD